MVAGKCIELAVITPEHKVLEAKVDSAVIPAHDGELGILFNRAPLMCELGIGKLRYQAGGRTHRLFVDGGFAQVYRNRVTVLSDQALTSQQVSDETIEEYSRRARDSGLSPHERARARRRVRVLKSLRRR